VVEGGIVGLLGVGRGVWLSGLVRLVVRCGSGGLCWTKAEEEADDKKDERHEHQMEIEALYRRV
jgi:hypothetical protein